MQTSMKTARRMWSITIATYFHSSAAWERGKCQNVLQVIAASQHSCYPSSRGPLTVDPPSTGTVIFIFKRGYSQCDDLLRWPRESSDTSYITNCPLNANLPIKPTHQMLCAWAHDHLNPKVWLSSHRAYVIGLLVWLHGLCDVFDALNGTFHLRVFDQGRVETHWWRPWLPRNVRNINVFCKNLFVLFFSGWSFHRGEEHEIWDSVDKNLVQKKSRYGHYCHQSKHQTMILSKQWDLRQAIQVLWASVPFVPKTKGPY